MLKLKVKNKKNNSQARIKVKFPITVHDRVLKMLNANILNGFLPVTIKTKKQKSTIHTNTHGLIPADKFFSQSVDKAFFLSFVSQIISRIETCEKNNINLNCISFDFRTIYINPETKFVWCVCWPIVNNSDYISPKEFFKNLLDKITFTKTQDTSFLNEYISFFNGIEPFSLISFKNLIYKLGGSRTTSLFAPNAAIDKVPNVSKSSFCQDGIAENYYDIFSQINKPQESGLKNNSFKKPAETTILGSSNLISQTNNQIKPFASLTNSSNFVFNIPTSLITIGKSENSSLTIEKSVISHHHADIVYQNDGYFLIDRHSTNYTYLNGQKLIPDQPYKLNDNDVIKFANQEYSFHLSANNPL